MCTALYLWTADGPLRLPGKNRPQRPFILDRKVEESVTSGKTTFLCCVHASPITPPATAAAISPFLSLYIDRLDLEAGDIGRNLSAKARGRGCGRLRADVGRVPPYGAIGIGVTRVTGDEGGEEGRCILSSSSCCCRRCLPVA